MKWTEQPVVLLIDTEPEHKWVAIPFACRDDAQTWVDTHTPNPAFSTIGIIDVTGSPSINPR